MSPVRALLVALLVLGTGLAGCIGSKDEGSTNDPTVTTTTHANNSTFVNPVGTKSAAANETNVTVVGKGGIEHKHDYWKGKSEQLIYDGDVDLNGPLFCDNKDTNKLGCQIVQLPVTTPATLVYEGATEMTIEVSAVQPWVTGLVLKYRNGANPSWGEPLNAMGGAVTIPLTAVMTDMPHASSSQWAWKFIGDKAASPSNIVTLKQVPADFHVKITVKKGGEIVNWPGHPDFYRGKPYRVVMDKDATTKVGGITDGVLYGDEANIVRPDLLISSGTGNITVYLNVTDVRSQTPVKPDRFFIEYTNATGYWFGDYDESGFGNNRVFGEIVDNTHYVMKIPVKYTSWDSPYAPVSGWQFLVRSSYSTPGVEGVVKPNGLCPGCLPYEVDFHMTVIAYPDPQYVGMGDALE